jgi:methionyl-tRNA synthetase
VKDPEFAGKFLYVWVDAPIGYLSSAEHYFAEEAPSEQRRSPAAFEKDYLAEGAQSRVEHFIGKDILRFHAVFWPAMLWAAGVKRPDRMPVHGHLTVNGEKMSKSRGTFITGKTYLDSGLDPELLRYFYASNLSPGIYDIDLSLEEFRNRINADLVKRIANLASRVHALVARAAPGGLARPADAPRWSVYDRDAEGWIAEGLAKARSWFADLEYRAALRVANDFADVANKALQDEKPWERLDAAKSRALLHDLGKVLHAVAVMLAPVMPRFASGLADSLGGVSLAWPEGFTPYDGKPVRFTSKPPQIQPIEAKQVEKLIVVTAQPEPQKVSKAPSPAETATKASAKPAPPPVPGVIQYEDFARVELKVAIVNDAELVPKADKLLKLSVDVGEPEPRTIVAGIAQAYPDPQALVGKRIVVVANLAPRPLRGITSQGMLLAAGEPPNLTVVTVGDSIAAGTRVK